MLTFPNGQYQTQDDYTLAGVLSDQQSDLLELLVANALIVAQFQPYDGSGKNLLPFGDEVLLSPGIKLYEGCAGVRVRSSVPGVPAQVIGALFLPDDPGRPSSAAAFDAYVSPAGTVASVLSLQSGDVFYSASPGQRDGVVKCDGSFYDSVADPSFANLFTAIGITYGGTGANHFAVPDLRDRVPVGAGSNTALGANEGIASVNRHATRHRHTVNVPAGAALGKQFTGASAGTAASPTQNGGNVTVGADPVNDPLDGPAFLGLTAYIVK